jgi:hypothetical protein
VRTDRKSLELLIENLAGLSVGDTERLARKAILDDGALLPSDLPSRDAGQVRITQSRRRAQLRVRHRAVRRPGRHGASERSWLKLRKPAFDGSAPQLEPPKGVLLLGVQGCGKSVAARAAAGIYGVPLLRLDFGAIHNKYIGESERNLRETLATANVMAPCVLWIDEIEKGLATGDGDSGTSRRLLGAFLTWLAERKSKVFVVATAQRHRGAAAGADPQGALRRDLLRRSARRRDPCGDPADPRTQAHAAACRDRSNAAGVALRWIFGRGDRAGGRLCRLLRRMPPGARSARRTSCGRSKPPGRCRW